MQTACEYCSNYVFDEEEEAYMCVIDMDEDDYARQMGGRRRSGCPYFSMNDEYKIVKKQI